MAAQTRAPAPSGLGKRGRRFWREVANGYELRPDELVLLETACRCIDLVADLEAGMADQPLTVKGSMGQVREHPLLSEQRQQRALLNRTLAQLDLPDAGEGVEMNQHRTAAQSRWARARGGA